MESVNSLKRPFRFEDMSAADRDRVAAFLKMVPGSDYNACSWNGIIDFLLIDKRGQFLAVLISLYNRTRQKKLFSSMDPGLPQVILTGENGTPAGTCSKIKASYGISGILDDYRHNYYPPGSPALVQEITQFMNEFFGAFEAPQGADH